MRFAGTTFSQRKSTWVTTLGNLLHKPTHPLSPFLSKCQLAGQRGLRFLLGFLVLPQQQVKGESTFSIEQVESPGVLVSLSSLSFAALLSELLGPASQWLGKVRKMEIGAAGMAESGRRRQGMIQGLQGATIFRSVSPPYLTSPGLWM